MSGLIADSRRLVKVAREEAGDYRFDKSEPIPVKVRLDEWVEESLHASKLIVVRM